MTGAESNAQLTRILERLRFFDTETADFLVLQASNDAAMSDHTGMAVALPYEEFVWLVNQARDGKEREAIPP